MHMKQLNQEKEHVDISLRDLQDKCSLPRTSFLSAVSHAPTSTIKPYEKPSWISQSKAHMGQYPVSHSGQADVSEKLTERKIPSHHFSPAIESQGSSCPLCQVAVDRQVFH